MSKTVQRQIIDELVLRHRKNSRKAEATFRELTDREPPEMPEEIEEFTAIFIMAVQCLPTDEAATIFSMVMSNVQAMFIKNPKELLKNLQDEKSDS